MDVATTLPLKQKYRVRKSSQGGKSKTSNSGGVNRTSIHKGVKPPMHCYWGNVLR